MKKNLWFAALALVAMTSCSNDDVMDVANNKAIEFKSFVNKNVRAAQGAQEVSNVENFYVFGEYGDAEGSYGNQVYKNELQSTAYYWVDEKYYSFGAYSDGTANAILSNASFNANEGTLTFPDYTAEDTKDLVAAVAKVQCTAPTSKVSLTFNHLLSQVKFTFTTTDADSYKLTISDLKVHAAKTGTGTYNGTATWTSTYNQTDVYTYEPIDDVSASASVKSAVTESKLVIPQGNTDQLEVTFTATITDEKDFTKSANFKGTLAVAENVAGTSAANIWKPGFRYNYTAEINGDKIDPSLESHKIQFTPSVESWQDATLGQDTKPQKQENPLP